MKVYESDEKESAGERVHKRPEAYIQNIVGRKYFVKISKVLSFDAFL